MTALAATVTAAAVLPAAAAAHGGGTAPATDWSVELRPVPGVEAEAVHGDQDLRLTALPGTNVEVLDVIGRPMLHVAGGETRTWHEHRLHAREPVGGGPFTIGLRVDGRRAVLHGTLVHHEPAARWPWLLGAIGLLAAGLVWRPLRLAAVAALAATAALRLGQGQTIAAVVIAVAGLAVFGRARSQDALAVAALAAGTVGVAQAIVSVPVLTRAIALSSLGTPGARAALVVAFAAGLVAASAGFAVLVRSDAR